MERTLGTEPSLSDVDVVLTVDSMVVTVVEGMANSSFLVRLVLIGSTLGTGSTLGGSDSGCLEGLFLFCLRSVVRGLLLKKLDFDCLCHYGREIFCVFYLETFQEICLFLPYCVLVDRSLPSDSQWGHYFILCKSGQSLPS